MFESVKIFGLHKGIEICGRDDESNAPKEGQSEKRAFDNIVVDEPVFDENANLVISKNGINLRIRPSNIAYEADGSGTDWEGALRDVKSRGDALVLVDLSALDAPAEEPVDD